MPSRDRSLEPRKRDRSRELRQQYSPISTSLEHDDFSMHEMGLGSPKRSGMTTALAMLQQTPYRVLIVAVLLLVVDIVLFVDHNYFFGDKEPPLPTNDFGRISGMASPKSLHKGSGYESHKHDEDKDEPEDCDCDPMAKPSKIIQCILSKTGAQQIRVKNGARTTGLQFQCAHTHDKNGKRSGCQCCDCGTEDRRIEFTAKDIVQASNGCLYCEVPSNRSSEQHGAIFEKGEEVHQLLFKLPLDVQHDASSFRVSLKVSGRFNRTLDSDVMIGVLDGRTGVVWLAQRGDNGMWFSVGKSLLRTLNKPFDKLDASVNKVEAPPKISVYDPHEMKYFKKGSRASEFGLKILHSNEGSGSTTFTMDNNLLDTNGMFVVQGSWTAKGWKVKRKGNRLVLYVVAYRDDTDEIYEFKKINVHYQKLG